MLLQGPAGFRKTGNPLENLPKNTEILTRFGERADISPDNRRVAFMGKSFGDALVIDLATRQIQCLTCNVVGAAFLRVMHLANGDYVLIGPKRYDPDDPVGSRFVMNELWYLANKPGARPVPFNLRLCEGAAISKKSMKIAWAEGHGQNTWLPPHGFRIYTADVDVSGTSSKLVNKRLAYQAQDFNVQIEPQDFFADDTKLTFAYYYWTVPEMDARSNVMVLDLKTGKAEDDSRFTEAFNEPEGIFPGGEYTLVESDRQSRRNGVKIGEAWQIDIYKLNLDGTGKNIERLTYFNDYEGWAASNPVVSTDGKFMAFSVSRPGDVDAFIGAGYGLLIYRFP
jgi:hypothetical protein